MFGSLHKKKEVTNVLRKMNYILKLEDLCKYYETRFSVRETKIFCTRDEYFHKMKKC